MSILPTVERAFLIPKDAAPTRLHGTRGSKKVLQSRESKASCVELSDMQLSIDWNNLRKAVSFRFGKERVGAVEIIIAGVNLGGGACREVKIKIAVKPVMNSPSRPSKKQKSRRISNVRDEFDMTGFRLPLHRLISFQRLKMIWNEGHTACLCYPLF